MPIIVPCAAVVHLEGINDPDEPFTGKKIRHRLRSDLKIGEEVEAPLTEARFIAKNLTKCMLHCLVLFSCVGSTEGDVRERTYAILRLILKKHQKENLLYSKF